MTLLLFSLIVFKFAKLFDEFGVGLPEFARIFLHEVDLHDAEPLEDVLEVLLHLLVEPGVVLQLGADLAQLLLGALVEL